MSKLTSKYQLTVPKVVAQSIGLKPGDEIECEPAGEIIRIRPKRVARGSGRSATDQLILFDLATERQRDRQHSKISAPVTERGWTRDELYET
jgi:AbrB family looped-hinge helix DNA binding protein